MPEKMGKSGVGKEYHRGVEDRSPSHCKSWLVYADSLYFDFVNKCRGTLLHCTNHTQQRHYTENAKQIFPEMKMRGLVPSSYIHVSASDLYIPKIGLPILLQQKRWADRGNV
jgi:hypothetical protein